MLPCLTGILLIAGLLALVWGVMGLFSLSLAAQISSENTSLSHSLHTLASVQNSGGLPDALDHIGGRTGDLISAGMGSAPARAPELPGRDLG